MHNPIMSSKGHPSLVQCYYRRKLECPQLFDLPTCHPDAELDIKAVAELSGGLMYKFSCAKTVPFGTTNQIVRKGTKNMLESVCFSVSFSVLYFKCLKCR